MRHDVLIHYDEISNKLFFYNCLSENEEEVAPQLLNEVEAVELMPVESSSVEDIERRIGRSVLLLLGLLDGDLSEEQKVASPEKQRDYQVEFERVVAENQPEALYRLFVDLRAVAIEEHSLLMLNKAELLLVSAASQGHEAARQLMNDWAALRAAAQWHIEQNIREE